MLPQLIYQRSSELNKICFVSIEFYLLIYFIYISSVISEEFITRDDKIDNAIDGEEFLKSLVGGKKPTEKPDFLLFTAPFKICKGTCKESNFLMSFPIYVGLKKGAPIYNKTYPRDINLYKTDEKVPFKKSTTRWPYTLCPTHSVSSEETTKSSSLKPNCRNEVRVSKVVFRDSLEFKQHKEFAFDTKLNEFSRNSATKPYKFEQVLRSRNKIWRPLSELSN